MSTTSSTPFTEILNHTQAGVCTLTLNRPDKKNALTASMYAYLAQTLRECDKDPQVRVVVIQAQPTAFTAGNDLEDFLKRPPSKPDAPVHQFLEMLGNFTKPLVAAVCGPAVGIGTTLLLHCDLVYAGDNAAFSLPFVNLGLCPEAGSSLLLPQLIGHQRAAQALLLGEPIQAEAALDMGLINRIVPPSECNALAQAQATKLASKPLQALLTTKRLLKQTQHAQVMQRLKEEGETFTALLQQPAAKEAFSAFLEKRKPDFSRF